MKVLLTGGSGFIGHYMAKALWALGADITFLERLSHSGNLTRVADIVPPGAAFKIIHHDLRSPISSHLQREIGEQDFILHLAASTHVDRAIEDPLSMVMDNVVGTTNILEFARKQRNCLFLYFSTDEVFGPAPAGTSFKEWDRYKSGNPYSAAKAGGEEMTLAFHNTYKLPVLITHTMNIFGQRQHPEKFIPSTIKKVFGERKVQLFADKTLTRTGSRVYLHGTDVANAVIHVLKYGIPGEKYNIAGREEFDNLTVAQIIAEAVGKPLWSELVNSIRPGYDTRYSLNGDKLTELGWQPKMSFDLALEDTVKWFLDNPKWL